MVYLFLHFYIHFICASDFLHTALLDLAYSSILAISAFWLGWLVHSFNEIIDWIGFTFAILLFVFCVSSLFVCVSVFPWLLSFVLSQYFLGYQFNFSMDFLLHFWVIFSVLALRISTCTLTYNSYFKLILTYTSRL